MPFMLSPLCEPFISCALPPSPQTSTLDGRSWDKMFLCGVGPPVFSFQMKAPSPGNHCSPGHLIHKYVDTSKNYISWDFLHLGHSGKDGSVTQRSPHFATAARKFCKGQHWKEKRKKRTRREW